VSTGFFSNKKGIKEAKEAAGAIGYAGASGMEATAASRAQAQAGEQAKFAVYGLLGKEGTYGEGSPTFGAEDYEGGSLSSVYDTSGTGFSQPDQGLSQMLAYSTGRQGLIGGNKSGPTGDGELIPVSRKGILDPSAYAKAISKTSAFKIQSQRVAESEQLLKQEGKEWDELENSTLGVINSGAATMLRDTLRQLRNDQAKGGAARRAAKDQFDTILAQERMMSERIEGTWKANVALFDLVRKNADSVLETTNFFVNNLPLINDSFRASIANNAAMAIQAGEVAAAAAQNAYAVKQSQQAVNFGVKLGEALIGAVASMIPYVGAVLGPAIQQAGSGGGYSAVGTTAGGGTGGGQQGGGGGGGIMGMLGGGGGGGMGALSGIMGAFGGGGGTAGASSGMMAGIGSFFGSDIRFKENLEKIGTENGYNIYKFNYKGDPDHTYAGVLAHEVIDKNPDAVEIYDGYYFVDYNRIGIKMRTI